jgi:hypothetical protein
LHSPSPEVKEASQLCLSTRKYWGHRLKHLRSALGGLNLLHDSSRIVRKGETRLRHDPSRCVHYGARHAAYIDLRPDLSGCEASQDSGANKEYPQLFELSKQRLQAASL